MPSFPDPQALLHALFAAALKAADPSEEIARHLPSHVRGRLVVVGAGKAAAQMARVVEERWSGPLAGLVVTRYGHGVPCERITVVEASHPVPDEPGARAAQGLIDAVSGLGPDDVVLALVSGGGSALLTLPPPGIPLSDLQDLTRALLASGASITEMNTIRRHVSMAAGGRLARAAAPARVVTLAVSDVPGDLAHAIASGPTVEDPTTSAEARAILDRHAIAVSPALRAFLASPEAESVKPGGLPHGEFHLVAAPSLSLRAAAELADSRGVAVISLGDQVEGEARDVAAAHAAELRARIEAGMARPFVILSGGETTVTLRGSGRGGRNAEYALALAIAMEGWEGVHALACDTDGIDGTQDNAGAIVSGLTVSQARERGIDAAAHLADNDAYGFFERAGGLVVTGPTGTNVNDFRAILCV
ncbi:glycerate kinase type-2 family protein [Salinarimonas soli]|uniref:Glycerate kinase n=1 Tax=Salinarimonas soli TaxID=1638099 RepID=A0A5B2VZT2_9HYPH|nr:glycerate kinase [Salinarimonas soli]KAA2244208.1 glycerate kinase [Salinarimonas soli]